MSATPLHQLPYGWKGNVMKLAACLLLVVALTACGGKIEKSSPPVVASTVICQPSDGNLSVTSGAGCVMGQASVHPVEPKPIAELRAYASAHAYRFEIVCNPGYDEGDEPSHHYLAWAEELAAPPHADYIEDGARPNYIEFGATQSEAAAVLLRNMRTHTNIYMPEHRPTEHHPKHGVQCKSPVAGGEDNRYYSECKNCGDSQ